MDEMPEPEFRFTPADVTSTPLGVFEQFRQELDIQDNDLVMVTVRLAAPPAPQLGGLGAVVQIGDDLLIRLACPPSTEATPTSFTATFLGYRVEPQQEPEFPPAVRALLERRRDQLAGRIRALRSEADGLVKEANRALTEVNCLEPDYRQLADYLAGRTGSTLPPEERERLREGKWRCPHSDRADGPRCEKELGHEGLHKMGSTFQVAGRAEERDGEIKFVCARCGHSPHEGRKCCHLGVEAGAKYCECAGEEG